MGRFTLTVRVGPQVERLRFASLEEALAALAERAQRVREERPLGAIAAFREYEPAERVAGRLEISSPGLRGPTAGLDVRGDGSFVPYRNAIFKRPLEAGSDEASIEAIRAVLAR